MTSEPTQQRARSRQERILDAALEVFTRRGFQSAAVEEIAAAAETSKGGVYFHFPGKDALFLTLLDRTASLLYDRLASTIARQTTPVARLDAALATLLELFASHRRLARLFLIETPGAGPRFYRHTMDLRARFTALIARELESAIASGALAPLDVEVVARAWFGALHEIVSQWALDDDPGDLRDALPALRRLLLRGIGVEA